MKWLALLLVIANAAFFGWRYQQRLEAARAETTVAVPIPPNTPSLQLISELDELPPLREAAGDESANTPPAAVNAGEPVAESAPPANPASPSPASPSDIRTPPETSTSVTDTGPPMPAQSPANSDRPEAPTLVSRPATSHGVASDICVNIGPFPDAKRTAAIEAWLSPRATVLYRVSQVMRKRQFFWVYLEPKNPAEARARVADLERTGVRDYLLVQRGGLRNAISLGLFSTQEAVNRRLSEMNRHGFQPVVVPRVEVTDYDWLRANLAVGFTDTKAIPREALAGAAVQRIACARIAEPDPGP